MEFLRADLNFFRRPGFPRNLWKPNALLMLWGFWYKIYCIWYQISGTTGVKDTRLVISLNFSERGRPKMPNKSLGVEDSGLHYQKDSKFHQLQAFLKSDLWIWRSEAVRDVAVDRTGQKAIDCRCYRLPTYPLPRSQIFSTIYTTNVFEGSLQ